MTRTDSFIGREQQLADLLAHWEATVGGHGGFVVVSGEPGIGKTRLVEHLAAGIGSGARVCWGACTASDAPALWPWRAVLRTLGATDSPSAAPRSTSSDFVDPVGDQARRLAAVVDAVQGAAATEPLTVVLDDLHWTDPDSIAVLRLLAADARRRPLLVVATLRPAEVEPGGALHRALTDLASSTHDICLPGLPSDDVAQLVNEYTGREPTAELVATVVDRTGGNPFFVRELLRLLVAEGSLDAAMTGAAPPVPPLVRDVLLRRVGQLRAATRVVLDAAAITGREVALPVLARVAAVGTESLVNAVDEAESARLLVTDGGTVRFSHDLVREAVVAALDPAERRRLHLAAGVALRDLGSPDATAAEIAGHLVDALPMGDPLAAAMASLAAGREAIAGHAPSDAVRHLERALAVLDRDAAPGTRGELLLALGEARTTAGDRTGAREAYQAAADVARSTGDGVMLAMSALGFAGVMGTPRTDLARVELLEEALDAVGDRRDALASRVMARLAHALLFSDQHARRSELTDDALALARETGDDRALASALYVWNIVNASATNYERRLARADELLALGRRSGADDVEAWALHFHAHHLAEGGDYAGFDADVAACDLIARRSNNATWSWTVLVHRAMRAAMQGRFDDAEVLGNEAFELGARSQHEVASATYGSHLICLRTWQGRLDELVPMIAAAAGRYPGVPAIAASLPFAHAEGGRAAEAAEALDRIVGSRMLEHLPDAQSWSVAVAMLARTAALTGDAASARYCATLLGRLRDRHIVGPFADCYFGPAALYLGLCAVTTGALDEACSQLEAALRQASGVGARPVVAWTMAELADALERSAADAARIADLRATAVAELEALEMPRHLARVNGRCTLSGPNVFVRCEGGWSITFEGRTVELRATKGLADLHRLLAARGTELHVLELAQEADGARPRAGRQPVLDEQAKAAYRRRVHELEAEIEDAKMCADLARAERAEREHDYVVAELVAAVGLGGRDRHIADEAERARQAVRARIRYTLDRIQRVHPALRRHLEHSLVTGTFCSYQPERETVWVTD
jgi:tetratricopeptide (TPR) repeat protein